MSVNGDKYHKGFNVKSQSNKELWSGCSGNGLERWASAYYAKEGVDPGDWSETFWELHLYQNDKIVIIVSFNYVKKGCNYY